jgi:hypothetical protein
VFWAKTRVKTKKNSKKKQFFRFFLLIRDQKGITQRKSPYLGRFFHFFAFNY